MRNSLRLVALSLDADGSAPAATIHISQPVTAAKTRQQLVMAPDPETPTNAIWQSAPCRQFNAANMHWKGWARRLGGISISSECKTRRSKVLCSLIGLWLLFSDYPPTIRGAFNQPSKL